MDDALVAGVGDATTSRRLRLAQDVSEVRGGGGGEGRLSGVRHSSFFSPPSPPPVSMQTVSLSLSPSLLAFFFLKLGILLLLLLLLSMTLERRRRRRRKGKDHSQK